MTPPRVLLAAGYPAPPNDCWISGRIVPFNLTQCHRAGGLGSTATSLVSTTCAADGDIRTFEGSGHLTPAATIPVGKVSALALVPESERAFASTKQPGIAHLLRGRVRLAGHWLHPDPRQHDLSAPHPGRTLPARRPVLGRLRRGLAAHCGRLGEATAHVEFRNLHCVITVGRHAYCLPRRGPDRLLRAHRRGCAGSARAADAGRAQGLGSAPPDRIRGRPSPLLRHGVLRPGAAPSA